MILRPSTEEVLQEVKEEIKDTGQEIRRVENAIDKRTSLVSMRLGNLEMKQPPLSEVSFYIGGIHFFGRTLDSAIWEQLKKFNEGDIEEIYCNDAYGVIISGVYKIAEIEMKEEKIGGKTVYSFSVHLKQATKQETEEETAN